MLNLEDNASNIRSFGYLFSDRTGRAFREAVTRSFSYASEVVRTIQELQISHKLELWDQAVSFKLGTINKSDALLADRVDMPLEKLDSKDVWKYGYSVLRRDGARKTRQWVLPDGLFITDKEIIAIEFDHGKTVGEWANKLWKAARGLASTKIDGLFFCYCFENGSHIDKLSGEEMTNEFLTLVDLARSNKPIGFITVFPHELKTSRENIDEIVDFFQSAYSGRTMSAASKEITIQIQEALRKREQKWVS